MKIIAVLLNPTIDQIYEIENFKIGGTFKVKSSIIYPVGKAISFSLGVRELTKEEDIIKVIACIGEADIPLYSHFLTSKNIDFEFVLVKGKTRSNKTINDPIERTTTHIREKGFDLEKKNLDDLIVILNKNIKNGDIVVFSGSIPPKTNINIYDDLITLCKKRGAITSLDTSGDALIEGIKAKPTIIKPNLVELSQILQDPSFNDLNLLNIQNSCSIIIEKTVSLLDDGIEIILVSLGDKGAVFITKDKRLYGNVKINDVIDTVGSGDSFLAGFIIKYAKNEDITSCFRTAVASGAANTQTPGPGIFNSSAVNKIKEDVEIINLD